MILFSLFTGLICALIDIMHDVFSEFDDCMLGDILVSYSYDLDDEKFHDSRLYIQKLINHIMEERNVSNIDIYR